MSDTNKILLRFQDDVFAYLLADQSLSKVNIAEQRKLLIASEVETSSVWLTPRGGGIGSGVLVGMPFIDGERKETGASQFTLNVWICCLANPNLVNKDGGSGITAEELVMLVRESLRGMTFGGTVGTVMTDGRSIEPLDTSEFIDLSGIVAYRVIFKAEVKNNSAARVTKPVINESSGTVTLTCAVGGASIYYSVDGTFPCAASVASHLYSAPFSVSSGATVRVVAYKDGLKPSNISEATII